MSLPDEYKWIKRWGQRLGSFPAYIKEEQARAAEDGAPINAIYKSHQGHWNIINDVQNQETREYFMKRYPGECPESWKGGGE